VAKLFNQISSLLLKKNIFLQKKMGVNKKSPAPGQISTLKKSQVYKFPIKIQRPALKQNHRISFLPTLFFGGAP